MKARISLLLAACWLPMLLSGCGSVPSNDEKPSPVNVTATCEGYAQPVPHAPGVPGKTDPNVTLRREAGQLDKSNENHAAGRKCQCVQRLRLAGNTARQAESACATGCMQDLRSVGYSTREAAPICRATP